LSFEIGGDEIRGEHVYRGVGPFVKVQRP